MKDARDQAATSRDLATAADRARETAEADRAQALAESELLRQALAGERTLVQTLQSSGKSLDVALKALASAKRGTGAGGDSQNGSQS